MPWIEARPSMGMAERISRMSDQAQQAMMNGWCALVLEHLGEDLGLGGTQDIEAEVSNPPICATGNVEITLIVHFTQDEPLLETSVVRKMNRALLRNLCEDWYLNPSGLKYPHFAVWTLGHFPDGCYTDFSNEED